MEMERDKVQESTAEMKRVLGVWDLVFMGMGMMIGAGVFVTTGYVAATMAGPGVTISYVVAGLCALLSALCYSEFVVDFPFAGGAYTFVSASLGEFLAFLCVMNLIFEYVLSGAAAIRGFSPYMAMLCNQEAGFFYTYSGGYTLDWWAFAIVLALTVLLVFGTKESSNFNLVVTFAHLVLVLFIAIAGFTQAEASNAQPFVLPDVGARGIFNGAAIVFFSYIGFDTVATAAEEVRSTQRDLPLGILGALVVTTLVYVLLSTALVTMVPSSQLSEDASFAWVFEYVGLAWAKYIVALGALMGIVTTVLVGMYGVSRIITTVGRDHLTPPVLALVHQRLRTPYVAILVQGLVTAIIALLTDFADLVEMVSISTLFAFWLVALGLLWRRGYVHGSTRPATTVVLVAHLAVIIGSCLGFTVVWSTEAHWAGLVVCAAVLIAAAVSHALLVRVEYRPSRFSVPLFPFLPIASIFLNTFLLGQLSEAAYRRFGWWTLAVVGIYLLYSLPASALRSRVSAHDLPQHGKATTTAAPAVARANDSADGADGAHRAPY